MMNTKNALIFLSLPCEFLLAWAFFAAGIVAAFDGGMSEVDFLYFFEDGSETHSTQRYRISIKISE
jgi:hypothetical protein